MHVRRWVWLALSCANASAADLVVYDDAAQNGFSNFSYALGDGVIDADNPLPPVRTGTKSIRFVPADFSAVSFSSNTSYSLAQYAGVRFWVHGGAVGGQTLKLNLYEVAGVAKRDVVLPLTIAPNAWQLVELRFANAPISYSGTFLRFDLQDGGDGSTQPALYLDDIALIDAAAPAVDAIFASSFEPVVEIPPPANALVTERDVDDPDVGCTGDRFTWRDADGEPRVAVLAHNTGQVCPGGSRGGELRLLKYQTPSGTRTVRAPATGAGGFGYAVSHRAEGMGGIANDDSPLGHGFTGNFARVFESRHHAQLRFTQLYPRYSRTNANPPNTQYFVPVTIDWFFSTGRDHPLWAITWDLSGVPADALNDDSRAPYGELLFDGAASAGQHAVIAGVRWGDRYHFTTTSAPASYQSTWSWNVANRTPYVALWTTAVDATMGTVLTQTIVQQDAGGYFGTDAWNTTSATFPGGNACTIARGGVVTRMPCNYNWPYQSINYSMDPFAGPNVPTNNTRLAWGTNFGFLGRTSYPIHGSSAGEIGGPLPGSPTASGWPRQSYAAFVVLDRNSVDPIGGAVAQVEAVQQTTFTATVGAVAASSAAGPGRADVEPLSPAGWDPYTAGWTVDAAANAIDVNFAVAAGALEDPMLVVRNWQGANAPQAIRLNGVLMVADADYFASVVDAQDRLYVTFDRDFVGAANRIEITP